jgi:hypothetical protein
MTSTALYISLWAYLFCVPLSEHGQVFGWLKSLLYKAIRPERSENRAMLYKVLIGCPKCHAGQIALWYQVWQYSQGRGFDIPFILIAISGAYALSTWHQIVEKHLNR